MFPSSLIFLAFSDCCQIHFGLTYSACPCVPTLCFKEKISETETFSSSQIFLSPLFCLHSARTYTCLAWHTVSSTTKLNWSLLWVVITHTCRGRPEALAGKLGRSSVNNRLSSAIFILIDPRNSGDLSLTGSS